jgi:hypothetical protein
MAFETIILIDEDNGSNRYIQAYIKDNGGNEIRITDETIATGAPLSTINLQAAWDRGVPVENGIVEWRRLEAKEVDELGRLAILALLDVVRASPTPSLPAMTSAALAVLDDNPKQLIAYNRIKSALDGANLAAVKDSLALFMTIAFSRLMQE